MRVHFLGVRGSTPAPGPEFVRYGGNTSAVAVGHDGELPNLLLDAGTGVRRLPTLLGEEPFQGILLLGHLHWDHTHGLPFSSSLDHPGATVDLYLPAQPAVTATEALERAMSPPSFPITPAQLRGHWSINGLDEGSHELGGFTVTAVEIPHKGGRTFGYRVSDGSATIAYLSDHGPAALGPGSDGLGERHQGALMLAAEVDLLIHDAQYTRDEFATRADYGHSTIDYAIDLACQAGARRVVLFHHDPNRTDDALDVIAANHAGGPLPAGPQPQITVASEGLVLDLGRDFTRLGASQPPSGGRHGRRASPRQGWQRRGSAG